MKWLKYLLFGPVVVHGPDSNGVAIRKRILHKGYQILSTSVVESVGEEMVRGEYYKDTTIIYSKIADVDTLEQAERFIKNEYHVILSL